MSWRGVPRSTQIIFARVDERWLIDDADDEADLTLLLWRSDDIAG